MSPSAPREPKKLDIDSLISHLKNSDLGVRQNKLLRTDLTTTTRDIKKIFGDLGKSLGYDVAASGYAGALQGEFLYDMVWFVGGGVYEQILVLETELFYRANEKSIEVDDDFLKITQAKADVRVWVSFCANAEYVRRHLINCKNEVTNQRQSLPGEEYIFVVFNAADRDVHIERWTV